MNKSIYEEAKRDLISLTAKFVIPNVEETEYGSIYDYYHFYDILDDEEESYLKKVEQALEQAQKQEKLLELYRELDDCIVAPTGHHVCRYTDDEKYARIRKQIKELEYNN